MSRDEPQGESRHLLLMDAGNTRLKWAVFPIEHQSTRALPTPVRFGALRCGEAFVVSDWCAGHTVASAALAGSNVDERVRIEQLWPSDGPPLTVWSNHEEFPLRVDVDQPDRVGIDRLLNAIAANRLRQPEQAAIIVDSGTATTVDLVSHEGTFCGGAILPGLLLSARALHEYTAVLPWVPLPQSGDQPPAVVGRNTEEAIISGVCWGHVGAVNGLIASLSADPSVGTASPLVLVTGGAGPWLLDWLKPAALLQPHLAFQGLYAVACGRE